MGFEIYTGFQLVDSYEFLFGTEYTNIRKFIG